MLLNKGFVMHRVWKLLKYLPPSVQGAIKRHSSEGLRIFIRERFGASPDRIPDQVQSVSDGRRFRIGPDWIYWAISVGIDFEPEPTEMVRRLLRPGDTVIDVGANFGWYTTLCAKIVGDQGKVFSFEPVPSTFARFEENLELNQVTNRVVAVRAAAGKEAGEVIVYVFDRFSHSCASLSKLDQSDYRTIKAPLVVLDDYLAEQGVPQVDFFKCDVEGSELSVLNGCTRILSAKHAPIVLVELNQDTSRAFGFQKQDIWNYLSEMGYDHFYEIRPRGRVRKIDRVSRIERLHMLLAAKGVHVEQRLAGRMHDLRRAA